MTASGENERQTARNSIFTTIDDELVRQHIRRTIEQESASRWTRLLHSPLLSVIVAGLLPIMWSHGTGSEVMQRIAAPMIGGMITAPLLSLLVIPAAYRILRRRELQDQ